jgi:hypothetical protein
MFKHSDRFFSIINPAYLLVYHFLANSTITMAPATPVDLLYNLKKEPTLVFQLNNYA